ncbi:hypothetical protein B7486_59280, partial [cyanobacterium TDX16]
MSRLRTRSGAVAVAVLALSAALVLLPAPGVVGQADGSEDVDREMVVESTTPELEVVPVDESPVGQMSAVARDAIDAEAAHEPERQLARSTDEQAFSMVGVGFEGGDHEPVLLRVLHTDGTWSEWVSLEVGGHEGEGAV